MKRSVALVLGAVAACPLVATAAPVTYIATFRPINYSGVTGEAELVLDGDLLTIRTTAINLTPEGPHRYYLRGLFDDAGNVANSTRPDQVLSDRDGDGYVEIDESLETLGAPLIDLGVKLTPDGTFEHEMTLDLSEAGTFWPGFESGDLFPLTERALVLHGRSLVGKWGRGTVGEINGENGFKPLLPVATAVIRLPTDPDDPEPGEVPGVIPTPAAAALGIAMLGFATLRRR